MADTPIDKLIFALDADLSALKSKFAEAEAQAQKTGTNLKANFGAGLKDAAADAARSATALNKALGDVDKTVRGTHGSVSMATREFRALFDELSSGRTRQTPGTLAIIATRVFGISGATLAWGAALTAIPAAMAYAAIQAESNFSRIQRTIEATGFAAGVTRDQIMDIGRALDMTSKLSERGATDIATILAGRGNVRGAQLPGATTAALGLSTATGLSYDKAAAELEKILADPAKGAGQLQEQFKLLTSAQEEEIRRMIDRGEKEQAQQVIIDSLNDRFKDLDAAAFSLSRVWDSVSKGFSDFWNHTGQFLGGVRTTDQRMAINNAQMASLDSLLRSRGIAGIDAARQMIARNPSARELGVGDLALGNIVNQYGALEKQQGQLTHDKTVQDNLAKGGALLAKQTEIEDQAANAGKAYESQAQKLKKLDDQIDLFTQAVKMAIGPAVQYQDERKRDLEATKAAREGVKLYGDPLQEAQRRAAEQQRINAARPEDRARISAEVEAQRRFREASQNPSTALNAKPILDLEMKTADMPDRYNRQADAHKRNLAAMEQEAAGAKELALAQDISGAAADEARIKEEAHLALVRDQITNEKAYADALRERAFWQAAAASAARIENTQMANAGLRLQVAAGTDPVALAQAKRVAEAQAATQKEFDSAKTDAQRAEAQKHYDQQLAALAARDQLNAQLGGQSLLRGAQNNLGIQQSLVLAQSKGFNSDDIRHLQEAQQLFQSLVDKGLDPATDGFKKLYNSMLPMIQTTGDLADQFQKTQQEAQDLANGITGPLESLFQNRNGGSLGQRLLDTGASIGDNLVNTVAKTTLFDPLNKELTSAFQGLLGGPEGGTADGTMTKPYYVVPLGASGSGGLPGVGGGSSGGLLGWLFGNSAGAGGAGGGAYNIGGTTLTDADLALSATDSAAISGGGGGFLSSILSFLGFAGGLAVGGPTQPGRTYLVGENGPELFAPGAGNVIPLSAPSNYSRAAAGASNISYGPMSVSVQFPNVHDVPGIIRSSSQIAGAVSKAAMKGRRNT